jgi:hypothetical protein
VTFSATPTNGGNNPLFQWKVNGSNISGATSVNYSYAPLTGDQVVCVLTSNVVCPVGNPATSNQIAMTVNPLLPVSITIEASANPVCTETPVRFSATAVNGGTSPSYQWLVNGFSIAGATNVLFTHIVTAPDQVSCRLTSNAVCPYGNPAFSNVITMGLIPDLQPGSIIANQQVCMNTSPAVLTGTPPANGTSPTYQWQSSLDNNTFNNILGATTINYQPGAMTATTHYRMMQNSLGTCGGPLPTNKVTIQVYPWVPVSVTISATATQVCAGTSVTYTAIPVNGGTTPVFQWKVNGLPVGLNSPVFSYVPTNQDVVKCILTSSTLCGNGNPATSNSITMTVTPIFQVGSVSADQSICSGETPSGLNAVPPGNGTQPAYQWQSSLDNNTFSNITGATMLTYQPSALFATTIYRQIQNSSGTCGGPLPTNVITVAVNPWVPVGITVVPSANPFCAGSEVTFTATPVNGGSAPVYIWKLNGTPVGTNSPVFVCSPLNNDVIACELTSNASCVTGNPAISNTVTMTENALNPASISIVASENSICAGTVVMYLATAVNGGSNPVYQWKVNGLDAGNNEPQFVYMPGDDDEIKCILTSNAFCVTGNPATSNTVVMTVNPVLPVFVELSASANPVCAGTSVTFTAIPVNGGANPSYDWWVNGSFINGNNSSSYTYTPSNDDVITVRLTSSELCTSGNPATAMPINMTVNPLLPVGITIESSAATVCAGTSVNYTATLVNGGNSPSYQWIVNDFSVPGATNQTFNFAPFNNDAVKCVLTSNATCATGNPATSNTITTTVNQILPVSVSIAASATTVCAGASVIVTATPVNGGSSPTYQWKLNNADVPGATNATYTFVPVNGNVVSCVLTSNAPCTSGNPASSNLVAITVNPLLPVSVVISASANPVLLGTLVTFTATPANGGSSPAYQWKVNGSNAGIGGNTYAYYPVNGDVVTCVLTSNAACVSNNPATSNAVVMDVFSVPVNLVLQNLSITDTRCYNATQTIVVAGGTTTFTVQAGASVTMIAGQKISYLPGTKVIKGGNMRGYISTNGQYCTAQAPSMVATVTGEEEIRIVDRSVNVKIYPNPTTSNFTLELTGVEKSELVNIEIYSMKGEKVKSAELKGELTHEFSLSDKPSGIYLIRVTTSNGSFTNRIVKR